MSTRRTLTEHLRDRSSENVGAHPCPFGVLKLFLSSNNRIDLPDSPLPSNESFAKYVTLPVFVNVFMGFFEKHFSYDVFHLKIGFPMKGPLSCEAKFWSSWTNKHWCCWFIDANSELEPLLSTNIYGGMNFFIYVYIKGFLCWTKYVDQTEAVKHNPRVDRCKCFISTLPWLVVVVTLASLAMVASPNSISAAPQPFPFHHHCKRLLILTFHTFWCNVKSRRQSPGTWIQHTFYTYFTFYHK